MMVRALLHGLFGLFADKPPPQPFIIPVFNGDPAPVPPGALVRDPPGEPPLVPPPGAPPVPPPPVPPPPPPPAPPPPAPPPPTAPPPCCGIKKAMPPGT